MEARILTQAPAAAMIAAIPMPRATAFLAFLILASAALAREPAPLPGAAGRVSLGAYVDVLEDPGGQLRLEDVRRPEHAARFAPGGRGPGQFRLYALGLVAALHACPAARPPREELLLEIAFPSIDRIELHLPEPVAGESPRYWMRVAGDEYPWDAREMKHRNYVFRFNAPQQPGAHVYYLRVQSHSVLTAPLTLWRPEAFAERDRDVQLAARRCSTASRWRWCCTT